MKLLAIGRKKYVEAPWPNFPLTPAPLAIMFGSENEREV